MEVIKRHLREGQRIALRAMLEAPTDSITLGNTGMLQELKRQDLAEEGEDLLWRPTAKGIESLHSGLFEWVGISLHIPSAKPVAKNMLSFPKGKSA